MKKQLTPEKVGFRISTTDLEVVYTESSGVKLRLDAQRINDVKSEVYRGIEITFLVVAELRCITLNFFDNHYDSFEIKGGIDNEMAFWEENGYHPNPQFYQVVNSDILENKNNIFDPNDRLDLKHYLITGYDSYVEVIASAYEVKCL
ncbi:Uncharacterised protein [Serratia fonticola]|uniref:hypothetical protein n=1 Tax=Serratia fonticola TaxID=47917 RepID=UPI00217B3236|nr:hypothetical protein [Serratia fonticola]CAI1920500.1 Uncharacterised protein [Serratia fonticola]